jgi:hypothetical protein
MHVLMPRGSPAGLSHVTMRMMAARCEVAAPNTWLQRTAAGSAARRR